MKQKTREECEKKFPSGYKVLEYNGCYNQAIIMCPEGHVYDLHPYNFGKSKCPHCRKLDEFEDAARSFLEHTPFELIEKNGSQCFIKCRTCGTPKETEYRYRKKRKCSKCYSEQTKQEVINKMLEVLPAGSEVLRYTHSKKPVEVLCPEKHVWGVATAWSVLGGAKCPECANRILINGKYIYDFRKTLKDRGWEYVSGEYKHKKSPIKAKCKKGHISEMQYNSFLFSGCPECNIENLTKWTEETAKKFLKDNRPHISLVSLERERPLKANLLCSEHGEFSVDWYDFTSHNRDCAQCAGNAPYTLEFIALGSESLKVVSSEFVKKISKIEAEDFLKENSLVDALDFTFAKGHFYQGELLAVICFQDGRIVQVCHKVGYKVSNLFQMLPRILVETENDVDSSLLNSGLLKEEKVILPTLKEKSGYQIYDSGKTFWRLTV